MNHQLSDDFPAKTPEQKIQLLEALVKSQGLILKTLQDKDYSLDKEAFARLREEKSKLELEVHNLRERNVYLIEKALGRR